MALVPMVLGGGAIRPLLRPRMRLCLAIALVLLPSSLVPAQVVPQGADADTVVRAYGAPRSRSATRDREIWTYPDFQVVFENGRMLTIAKRDEGGTRVEWAKNAPKDASGPAPVGTPRNPGKNLLTPGDRAPGGAPMTLDVEAGKIVLRSPTRPAAVADQSSLGDRVMRAIGPFVFWGFAVAAVGWMARRKWRQWRAQATVTDETKPAVSVRGSQPSPVVAPVGLDPAETTMGKPPSLSDWEIPLELLRSIEWKRFELLLARFYVASGFLTKGTNVGADDGVNLFLYRRGAKRPFSCVQCKAWSEKLVELTLVRELFDEMAARGLAEGVIVTTGNFTPEAVAFAGRNQITLWSGTAFITRFNRLPILARERIIRDVTAGDYTTPSCPRCAAKLELRGQEAGGGSFWGCRRYPVCRYTMKGAESIQAMAR
jgi:hypothetical protein